MKKLCKKCEREYEARTNSKYCLNCRIIVKKERMESWKRSHEEHNRNYAKLLQRKLRQDIKEAHKNKCLFCGYTTKLEIHHVNHNYQVDPRRWYPRRKDIQDKNVILLCFLCHRMLNRLKYLKRIAALDIALNFV